MKNSILNVSVSCFENCKSTIPREIPLLSWLTSEKYRDKVLQLRSIQDEDLQKFIKTSLPAITPSGLFRYRAEKDLILHSGFMAFDIDKKDNTHIVNFSDLREQISHISSVAYCGLSVRGQGYWGLMPIPESTPEEHKQRFSMLVNDFKGFGINLDVSGSDVCRLRIYSWDSDAYFNHSAKLYTKLPTPQQKPFIRPASTDTRNQVESIISQIKETKIDITGDYKEEWLKIASALSNEFGEAGRQYFHSVSMFHPEYLSGKTDYMYDNCLKHNYNRVTIASFFQIASAHSIDLKAGSTTRTDKKIHAEIFRPVVEKLSEPIIKVGLWDQDIFELEQYFNLITKPLLPIRLNQCTTIPDIPKFIESHMSIVKNHNGNNRYKPYLDRLEGLKSILSRN